MDTGSSSVWERKRPGEQADLSGACLRSAAMVLSDQAIRRLIEAGRIGIEPYEAALMQPSSLDVRVDRLFRVFRNSRYPYIDVKTEQAI